MTTVAPLRQRVAKLPGVVVVVRAGPRRLRLDGQAGGVEEEGGVLVGVAGVEGVEGVLGLDEVLHRPVVRGAGGLHRKD